MSSKLQNILSAWASFFVAHALSIQAIERELQDISPLSLHEYDTLLTISRAKEGRLRYSELTAESLFTKSGVSRITKRLIERGFLARIPCESDARGAFLSLTPEGQNAMKETWELYSNAICAIFDPAFSEQEAIELRRLMDKIIDQLEPPTLVSIGSP